MRFNTFAAAAALAVGTTFAVSSFAATIQSTGSFDGPTQHLYQLFGGIGATSLDTAAEVNAAQIHNDQYWSIQGGAGGSLATMIFEISANSGGTSFGVFDKVNSNLKVQLWDGSATQGPLHGSSVTMTITGTGRVILNNITDTGINFAGNTFGYYIRLPNGTFYYSDEALNPTGADQMVAFQGNGTDQVTIPGYATGTFGSNEYFIGWEDILASLPLGTTDNDYNDLVVGIESVQLAVPEPGTLAVLGLGLLGLGMARRRSAKA